MDHYINKTFFKTASLMANSCKAVAVLGGHGPAVCQAAWEYGRHLGLAFQVSTWVLHEMVRASRAGCRGWVSRVGGTAFLAGGFWQPVSLVMPAFFWQG